MKNCRRCGKDISHKAPQARNCDECRKRLRCEASKKSNKLHPEWSRNSNRTYRKNNPERRIWWTRVTKGDALRQQCPVWVDRQALKAFYLNKPVDMQVDHIVPLQGDGVMGLHVPWNLQYLSKQANSRKGNRYEQHVLARPKPFPCPLSRQVGMDCCGQSGCLAWAGRGDLRDGKQRS